MPTQFVGRACAHATQARRLDADGLRGIAILSVLIFHAVPSWLPGGFAGVDVFFVLSGFLVGRLVLLECRDGSFSFANFYARRARRLFPPLLVVLLATMAAAPLLVGAGDYVQVGSQAAAAALFVANFLAWIQSGYFDVEAAYKPLIHLWSLGVEEQFYLVFPLCVVAMHRRAPCRTGVVLACAAAVSFTACVALTPADSALAFYLPATRFWEFLAGSLLAWCDVSSRASARRGADLLAAAGAIVLAFSFFYLSSTDDFPGWRAALPVAGTCLLLAAGPAAWVNRKVLGLAFLRWMGKVSYAAYLFHWPLLVFGRIQAGGELHPADALWITALSVVLAWASTQTIERKFTFGAWSTGRAPTAALWGSCALVALIAVPLTRHLDSLTPSDIARLEHYPAPEVSRDIWRERSNCFINYKKDLEFGDACLGGPPTDRPLMLLWGDSHAAHLWPGMKRVGEENDWPLAQLTVSQCPALTVPAGERNRMCARLRESALRHIAALKPDTVVMASRWTFYDKTAVLAGIEPTVAELKALGVRRVVVVGPVPNWQPTLGTALAADMRARHMRSSPPDFTRTGLQVGEFVFDAPLRQAAVRSGAAYISALELLCSPDRICKAWVDKEKTTLMTFDNAHLTEEGSVWLVKLVVAQMLRLD
ncbi:acyltransferase family protein [Ramlibacter albus]|uniref:Acyltransferase n=1 Tax=Ramlibacter albus TaxID=2079448 RepID=A0A923M6J7_9BURK|nr:acyltransferase family protein [Ramlibacter albus]MBC5765162.1 acyltransferase [Ramlibacter albus]